LEPALLHGVEEAATVGLRLLADRALALDAAVAAVVSLEDNPVFNAGTGAALNLDGEAELDAGVMFGPDLRSGNVAGLRRVRNPILVARRVLEDTDHVLLAGDGALRFARTLGFADYDPITPERRQDWRRQRALLAASVSDRLPRLRALVERYPGLARGTVGAVALGSDGAIAAATSTGGLALKLAGRVGDTPIPGAGHCACATGGACATGQGELMLRFGTARLTCELSAGGRSPRWAVAEVLRRMATVLPGDVGIIALDRYGRIGVGHSTPGMPHAFASASEPRVRARLSAPSRH
jgi:beta-aspartyl-peptidase (threonine type)